MACQQDSPIRTELTSAPAVRWYRDADGSFGSGATGRKDPGGGRASLRRFPGRRRGIVLSILYVLQVESRDFRSAISSFIFPPWALQRISQKRLISGRTVPISGNSGYFLSDSASRSMVV